jgi:hypothetical protein
MPKPVYGPPEPGSIRPCGRLGSARPAYLPHTVIYERDDQPVTSESVPGKRKPLMTLRDALKYMSSLPRKEQKTKHWRPAATLLAIIGEKGRCMFFAERAVAFGLRKRVKDGSARARSI